MTLKTVLKTTRPPFLVLPPICVFLGISLASLENIDAVLVVLIAVGAICAHISVNTLNEYFDFKSGLDLSTQKTPFSGGSGALPDNPASANLALLTGLLSILVTITIGLYFAWFKTPYILPLGIIGVVLVLTYTQWINRAPLVCLIAPGLGFGIIMVVGTFLVLSGENQSLPWLVALVPFFLTNNLLLLNQYPDVEADKNVGRKTFPIVFGFRKSNLVYGLFAGTSYILIALYIALGLLPMLSLIALIPALFSLFALSGALKHNGQIGDHPQYLAGNVIAAVFTPLLLGISLL